MASGKPRTLFDKIWDAHIVDDNGDGSALIYIDRHIIHEVTTPQAFEGLRNAGRKVRRPDNTLATCDHNVPTDDRTNATTVAKFIKEADSRTQVMTLEENVHAYGLTYFGLKDKRQGIVHVIGPEQGFTLPGSTVCCGDSHTSTHGAFGAYAFGIGTSEVEHILATQCLPQRKAKNMRIRVNGTLAEGVTSKDVILHVIGVIGTAGGTGHVIEYCGKVFEDMSMENRMSVCNMSIEAGARAGLVAPDEKTFAYLKGRPLSPKGADWEKALSWWRSLKTDPDAAFDKSVDVEADDIGPTVSWGTSPQDVVPITGRVPDPTSAPSEAVRKGMERALEYMGLEAGTPMEDIKVDKVFLGSCTNSRIEDLRSAAKIVKGKQVAPNVYAMVVPGSGLVKQQAEKEGLDRVFKEAGFDWREAGCSMCLGMNPDQLKPGERCASTSNRNFEGRQGPGGRTHLMSPGMAAAAAIEGKLTDVRKLMGAKAAKPGSPEPRVEVGADEAAEDEAAKQAAWEAPDKVSATPSEVDEHTDGMTHSDGATKESEKAPAAAGLPKFEVLKGIAARLDASNVDTDKIIPAVFLKTIKRTGLGKSLFYPMRYDAKTGEEVPGFVLNQEPWRHSKILVVTGPNFGCGSSREHAPWALLDFGIRCIIGTSYADIFYNNTFKNGMLPLILPQADVDALASDAAEGKELEVDLVNDVIRRPDGAEVKFELDPFRKHCLVNGLDDIGLTEQKVDRIERYEKHRTAEWPWLDGIGYQRGMIPVEVGQQDGPPGKKQKIDW